MKKITIYTDGACSGNPGPGGWGAILIYKNYEKELFGYDLDTTNNRMELMAAIEAISSIKEKCDIELYTDSIYLKNGITEWIHNWIKKGYLDESKNKIKNVDLWQKIHSLNKMHKINWLWIKGHSNNHGNIRADELAVKGRKIAEKILNDGAKITY